MKRISNTVLGGFILVTLAMLTVTTLVLSGVPLTPHTDWTVFLGEDSTLLEGVEVFTSGMKIGNVTSVEAVPDEQLAPNRYVKATISLRSDVTLWEGAEVRLLDRGLIGGFVVVVHRGRPGAKKIGPETPLIGRRLAGVVQELSSLIHENREYVNNIVTDLADVTASIKRGDGTLGRLVQDPAVYENFASAGESLARITSDIESDESAIGLLLRNPEVYHSFKATMERVASVMEKVESGQGVAGALLMDDKLEKEVRDVTTGARLLMEELQRGEGTLGAILKDPQMRDNLMETIKGAREIMERFGKGGGTLDLLLNDRVIFDNLMAVSVNLKDVSADIRQGKGSLGLLLKDEALYREATRLFESFREAGEIARENAPIASLVSFTSLFFSALN
ncbi:MAG: MlaD family protein [Planctomycetota bacterium]|jgi:phospholipid/cholesterol/gamma-HCH transport system substrate-binding protein